VSEFVTIPGHPDYRIDPLGQVETVRTRRLLAYDRFGRVELQVGKRRKSFHSGELLALAGFMGGAPDAVPEAPAAAPKAAPVSGPSGAEIDLRAELAGLETELKKTRESLDKSRKSNALLLGIRKTLTRRIDALEQKARSRAREARRDEMEPPDIFESWEEAL
jgi:hypothetical protein